MNKSILRVSPSSLALLTRYDWPGNVRELENLIERAMIVAAGDVLDIDASWLRAPAIVRGRDEDISKNLIHEHEKKLILEALDACAGKIYGANGAAARLGVKPTTLYGKMKRLGIRTPKSDAR